MREPFRPLLIHFFLTCTSSSRWVFGSVGLKPKLWFFSLNCLSYLFRTSGHTETGDNPQEHSGTCSSPAVSWAGKCGSPDVKFWLQQPVLIWETPGIRTKETKQQPVVRSSSSWEIQVNWIKKVLIQLLSERRNTRDWWRRPMVFWTFLYSRWGGDLHLHRPVEI